MTKSSHVDDLVLLLSTDWFFPYWSSVGIETVKNTGALRDGCRELVTQILSGANNYWHRSFEDKLIQETQLRLDRLLIKYGAQSSLDLLTARRARSVAYVGSQWLLEHLTKMYLTADPASALPPLDSDIGRVLRLTWERCHGDFSFQTLALNSSTVWDRYIRGLTPLPDLLSNFLTETMLVRDDSSVFRAAIGSQLNTTQKRELENWYRAATREITGSGTVLSELRFGNNR